MLIIDYTDNIFHAVHLMDTFDPQAAQDMNNFLKSYNIYCNEKSKKHVIPVERLDEIILWFDKTGLTYRISEAALNKIETLPNELYPKEQKLFRGIRFDRSILNPGIEPFNYQVSDIEFMLSRNRVYNANDPGLGKTFETICTFSQLYKEGKIDSVFIVVKNSLPYHWKKEILEFTNIFSEEDILIVTNDNKIKCFDSKYKIIIVGNHLLGDIFGSYRKDYGKKRTNKKTGKIERVLGNMSQWQWKQYVDINKEWDKTNIAIVVDEAHELKNLNALRTKALDSHKDNMDYRYWLSATPAINFFEDWYSAFHFIDPSVIPMSYNAFKIYISNSIGNRFNKYAIEEYSASKISEVKSNFSSHVIKRLKSDLPEMKAKQIVQPYYFPLPKEHKDLYNLFMSEEIRKLSNSSNPMEGASEELITDVKAIFNDFPYLLQIIDNPLLLKGKLENDNFNSKLNKWTIKKDVRFQFIEEQLKDYIENQKEKVIIFDIHPLTLDLLHEEFAKYNPLIIHGKTGDNEQSLFQKVELFNDLTSKHKLILFSTIKGGPGLNLQKGSRRIIYWTLPYDTTLYKQSMDRTHRITSERDSVLQIPLLDHTIDIIRFNRNIGRLELNDNILNEKLTERRLMEILYGKL